MLNGYAVNLAHELPTKFGSNSYIGEDAACTPKFDRNSGPPHADSAFKGGCMVLKRKYLVIAVAMTAFDLFVVFRYGVAVWQAYANVLPARLLLVLFVGSGPRVWLIFGPGRFAFQKERLAHAACDCLTSWRAPQARRRRAMFESLADLSSKLMATGYFVDPVMIQVIFLAAKLQKHLLLEGQAGSGKTQLAISVAAAAGTHVERLQCYRDVSEDKAIGRFDERLQRLYMEPLEGAA